MRTQAEEGGHGEGKRAGRPSETECPENRRSGSLRQMLRDEGVCHMETGERGIPRRIVFGQIRGHCGCSGMTGEIRGRPSSGGKKVLNDRQRDARA